MIGFRNYFYRMIKHPLNLAIFLLLPGIIIALNIMILNANGDRIIIDGFDMGATGVLLQVVDMFQLFGASTVYDLLYSDFRSDRRWRLLAAPKSLGYYLRANIASAIIVNMISGVVILTVGRLIFDAYLFNLAMVMLVLLVLSTFSMGLGILIFLCSEKKGSAEGLVHAFVWPQFIPLMMGLATESGTVLHFIFQRATPVALGMNAIALSAGIGERMEGIGSYFTYEDIPQAFTYLGILAGMAAVIWIAAFVMSRTKRF